MAFIQAMGSKYPDAPSAELRPHILTLTALIVRSCAAAVSSDAANCEKQVQEFLKDFEDDLRSEDHLLDLIYKANIATSKGPKS